MKEIRIRGARVNNLKNVDVDIPLHKITCFIGPSGSGKSSLAFHTLYSESKRRFLNSFPTYLKFFSDRPAPVDVDSIDPVLPVFGLPQINPVVGTRSNAADVMQLSNHLQGLFYYEGEHLCPTHHLPLESFDVDSYLKDTINYEDTFHVLIKKEDFQRHFHKLPFPTRSLKSKRSKSIKDFEEDDKFWEVFRFKTKHIGKLAKKFEDFIGRKLEISILASDSKKIIVLPVIKGKSCPKCDYQEVEKASIKHFSAYNALGSCKSCNGFGATLEYDPEKYLDYSKSIKDGAIKILESKRFSTHLKEFKAFCRRQKISPNSFIEDMSDEQFELLHEGDGSWYGINTFLAYLERKKYKAPVRIYIRSIQTERTCEACEGSRVGSMAHNYFLPIEKKVSFKDIWSLSISEIQNLISSLNKPSITASAESYKKLVDTLKIATDIGLGHLVISRKTRSLSSGEYQRLLLLKYLAYEGTGGLFIFDEPTLGLSKSEVLKLYSGFEELIKQKNTVILIEHNKTVIDKSDHVIEMGPSAGKFGGEITGVGPSSKKDSKQAEVKSLAIKTKSRKWIKVKKPLVYGLNFQDFKLPINELSIVKGKSGSGKTASIINTLAYQTEKLLGENTLKVGGGEAQKIDYDITPEGVIVVASNLNRYTSRSTVGSLTGLVSMVRRHFLALPVVKAMNLKDGHFSANSDLGRCPTCNGRGVNIIEMQFLEDVILECEDCQGKKIKLRYADLSDGKRSYHDYLASPLNEIIDDISLTPKFKKIWEFIKVLNLDYLSLNREMQSLSGGEKQRMYLLSKLTQKLENNLIIFENISFGLSRKEELSMALLLQKLSLTNTVVVIDQSEVLEKAASYILEF